jgi:hypothetical protein
MSINLPIPKCHCGKETVYRKDSNGNCYSARCSMKCRSNDLSFCKKISETKYNLYKNKEWKEQTEKKKTSTTMKHYGVEYPMQNIPSFEKQQMACFKKDENGLHGYEPYVYGFLKQLYPSIQHGTSYLKYRNLKIEWIGSDNKNHRSYPDFFSEELNSFIEIKSEYTRKLHHNKLIMCKDALNRMRYGYIICVVYPKKKFIFETYGIEHIIKE